MKRILLAVIWPLLLSTLSKVYCQATSIYRKVKITEDSVRGALKNPAFDHFVFNFWIDTNSQYRLKGMKYSVSSDPIDSAFDLQRAPGVVPLKNYQKGIFYLSRKQLEDSLEVTLASARDIFFSPEQTRRNLKVIDFVSYEVKAEQRLTTGELTSTSGNKPKLYLTMRMNPAPPF